RVFVATFSSVAFRTFALLSPNLLQSSIHSLTFTMFSKLLTVSFILASIATFAAATPVPAPGSELDARGCGPGGRWCTREPEPVAEPGCGPGGRWCTREPEPVAEPEPVEKRGCGPGGRWCTREPEPVAEPEPVEKRSCGGAHRCT
ncbi:hypothetical protein BD410DRAFT_139203, partial [Rickenella mellea]